MAKYHVGCGLFGIYAGVLDKSKKEWKYKSEVTEEAILAVVQYIKEELEAKEKSKFHSRYRFNDGTLVDLDISIVGKENKEE